MSGWHHDTRDEDPEWCVLCGMQPMPIAGELPDGCRAHPGCITDPVHGHLLHIHGQGAGPGPFAIPRSHDD